MQIQLSDNFTYKKLIKFSLPSVLMMVFTSIYGVVDGFFISNFVGKDAFAGINFIMPFIMVLGSFGFMVGTGGCALIGKTLGEGDKDRANKIFSMLVYITLIAGVIIEVAGMFLLRPIALLMGASESMADICEEYGKTVLTGLPFLMLQYEFHSFCVLAEKPKVGFIVTLIAGSTNIVLDGLLVGVFKFGVVGAAIATVASQVIGGGVPFVYFIFKNTSLLRLRKVDLFKLDFKSLLQTLWNGSSEFVSNISMSIVGILYNVQLLKYSGENGVSAYGVLMYVNFIFIAMFIGYSVGTAPIVSYNFGSKNQTELKNVFRKSLHIIVILAILMVTTGELFARPLSMIFVGYDSELLELTVRAFRYFSISYLFASLPIYGSSFFTALNNGLVSALISFLRTIVFQVGAVLLFPLLFGIDGIWLSLVFAEFIAATVTIIFWLTNKKKYNY